MTTDTIERTAIAEFKLDGHRIRAGTSAQIPTARLAAFVAAGCVVATDAENAKVPVLKAPGAADAVAHADQRRVEAGQAAHSPAGTGTPIAQQIATAPGRAASAMTADAEATRADTMRRTAAADEAARAQQEEQRKVAQAAADQVKARSAAVQANNVAQTAAQDALNRLRDAEAAAAKPNAPAETKAAVETAKAAVTTTRNEAGRTAAVLAAVPG